MLRARNIPVLWAQVETHRYSLTTIKVATSPRTLPGTWRCHNPLEVFAPRFLQPSSIPVAALSKTLGFSCPTWYQSSQGEGSPGEGQFSSCVSGKQQTNIFLSLLWCLYLASGDTRRTVILILTPSLCIGALRWSIWRWKMLSSTVKCCKGRHS